MMDSNGCYAECQWYEDEYTYEEQRAPGHYEAVCEPPTCKYDGEPYMDTAPGWACPNGMGRDA